MVIPGSEYLGKILHGISQSFLIPCILGLIIFLVLSFVEFGTFVAESKLRKKKKSCEFLELRKIGGIQSWQQQNLQQIINNSFLHAQQKQRLLQLIGNLHLTSEARQLLARQIFDSQELQAAKTLEKTDIIAKLGPVLGLMGTLIPLGPGLAALGQGDITSLAQAVIVAFDTTVAGITAGGIALVISKVRRRWYEQDLNNLEVLLQIILGGEDHAVQENKAGTVLGRRN